MCGGTVAPPHTPQIRQGLSPRVRGNPRVPGRLRVSARSIPACAGEPRYLGREALYAAGLSPRVRGNLDTKAWKRCLYGSIPACAGEPRYNFARPLGEAVYPRVCGGTIWYLTRRRWATGLSPRVRGNHQAPSAAPTAYRSIPACAGEPRGWNCGCPSSKVYPRVCGGTAIETREVSPTEGLSPRVRGNPDGIGRSPGAVGSIPACAGEPPRRWCRQ